MNVRPLRLALFATLALTLAAAVSSIWRGPPPIWVSALLLATLLGLVTAGSLFLNLGVFVRAVRSGSADRATIAFTFDDGPHAVHTRRVMDLLEAADARGTFFVIGEKARREPALVREMASRGHEVALHSDVHDRFLNLRAEPAIAADLSKNQDAVERAASVRPHLFRPPVGLTSPRIQVAVEALGLTVVGWSARAFDGATAPDVETTRQRVLPGLAPGAIVLLHDAKERGDDAPSSIEALPSLLEAARARGLRCVTVSELLTA